MKKENVKKVIGYWQKTAKRDYDTMLGLFKIKRYPESLFYGHIVLEKILKALVVKHTEKEAPYIHDLLRLREISETDLSEEQIDLLDTVNDFNIRARYPERKLQFYKKCDREYVKDYLDKIIKLYKELCQKLKQKK
ncbi:HEPN domain-containing protein [Patescibacteria group bacterium]|nr:HEPN domain-containing protein [Patescibacteria group bacterium]MBU4512506.1 HEPN domain-containing protein [Patescibacteria group bacterium]MCG2693515.1 HEPN domain-containing protein [Candidatus Parcubacteria bacterium]